MEKTQILTVGRHPEILQTVVRLVNNNPEWLCTGVTTNAEALAAFEATDFKLVLLGGGIEPDAEQQLRAAFKALKPAVIIVQHFGGGSGLLTAEIYEALAGR